MCKKFIAILSVTAFVAAAAAGTIYPYLEDVPIVPGTDALVPAGLYGYRCFDLKIRVTDDIWSTAYASWSLTGGGTFWEHPAGQDIQPQDLFLGLYGYLKYDSFWTTPEEFPNPNLDPDAQATNFAPGNPSVKTPTRRVAEWYVDPEDPTVPSTGDFTIARYTILPTTNTLCYIKVILILASSSTPYTFCWGWPPPTAEPSSLALLSLGAVGLIRRR